MPCALAVPSSSCQGLFSPVYFVHIFIVICSEVIAVYSVLCLWQQAEMHRQVLRSICVDPSCTASVRLALTDHRMRRNSPVTVTYHIDVARRLVRSHATGRLTDADLQQHQQQLRQEAAFDPTFCQLLDWTGVTALALTGDGLRHVLRRRSFSRGRPGPLRYPTQRCMGSPA